MRVHGKIKILRRTHVNEITQQSAREMLEADFKGFCG